MWSDCCSRLAECKAVMCDECFMWVRFRILQEHSISLTLHLTAGGEARLICTQVRISFMLLSQFFFDMQSPFCEISSWIQQTLPSWCFKKPFPFSYWHTYFLIIFFQVSLNTFLYQALALENICLEIYHLHWQWALVTTSDFGRDHVFLTPTIFQAKNCLVRLLYIIFPYIKTVFNKEYWMNITLRGAVSLIPGDDT